MTDGRNEIVFKIEELERALQQAGLWQKTMPQWVNSFEGAGLHNAADFAQWLQFVFIPNHIDKHYYTTGLLERKFMIPAAIKYFGTDVSKRELIQILIELDAIL